MTTAATTAEAEEAIAAAEEAVIVAEAEETEFKRLLLSLHTARTCGNCGHRDMKVQLCNIARDNHYSINSSVAHNYEWLCLECAC